EGRREEEVEEEEMEEHVEVEDDSLAIAPSSSVSLTLTPSLPLSTLSSLSRPNPLSLPPLTEDIVRSKKNKRQPSRAAQRIIRAVEEAHSNLEYERRRSEYEDSWMGSSLEGVLIEDGARVVYAHERSGHIEVGEDLHHMQARSASAGVYEYPEHSMDDHYGAGPDMVEHEVEVPHSPHHHMHHVHHMEGDIDVVHADDDDDMRDWDSDVHHINIRDRPYQPRDKTLMDGGERGESARILEQRARRALRSRMRYANMSSEEKARHNAERAKQLREARRRDMQLLQMADNEEVMMDEEMRKMVEAAQERRNRRAEQARHKYRRMTEEERRAYNAMRDAQRRSRRREQEGLTDGEEMGERERDGEEMRRVRGGGRASVSSAVSSMAVRGGGGASSTASEGDHHHLQRAGGGGGNASGHYGYEMYEQEWTGHH
ncbi:hypothetical protein PENTCL1PPCAC_11157, partial [Pristionchus entomophagus]